MSDFTTAVVFFQDSYHLLPARRKFLSPNSSIFQNGEKAYRSYTPEDLSLGQFTLYPFCALLCRLRQGKAPFQIECLEQGALKTIVVCHDSAMPALNTIAEACKQFTPPLTLRPPWEKQTVDAKAAVA